MYLLKLRFIESTTNVENYKMTEQVMISYFLRKIDNIFFIVKSFQSRDPIGVIILVSLLFLATSPQGICGHIFQVSNHVKIKFWRASKCKKVRRKFQIRRPHRKQTLCNSNWSENILGDVG